MLITCLPCTRADDADVHESHGSCPVAYRDKVDVNTGLCYLEQRFSASDGHTYHLGTCQREGHNSGDLGQKLRVYISSKVPGATEDIKAVRQVGDNGHDQNYTE